MRVARALVRNVAQVRLQPGTVCVTPLSQHTETNETDLESDSQNKFSTRGEQFYGSDESPGQTCGPGSTPTWSHICGLSFLLVLTLLRGFFYGFSGFPSHGINQHLKTHVDQD